MKFTMVFVSFVKLTRPALLIVMRLYPLLHKRDVSLGTLYPEFGKTSNADAFAQQVVAEQSHGSYVN